MSEKGPTPFAESNAILYALDRDFDRIEALLSTFLDGELRALVDACRFVEGAVRREQGDRRDR